jgi:hypothetical protein
LALNSFAKGFSGGPSRLTIQVLLDFASVGHIRDALLDSTRSSSAQGLMPKFPKIFENKAQYGDSYNNNCSLFQLY